MSRRHDFALRKLSLCAVLLTLGSTSVATDAPAWLATPSLLYLVPPIALAFDLHIVAEDHRIKRAGIFLRDKVAQDTSVERDYERFVSDTTNVAAPLTLAAVTAIMLAAATILLWPQEHRQPFFPVWLVLCLAAEMALVARAARVRLLLERQGTAGDTARPKKGS